MTRLSNPFSRVLRWVNIQRKSGSILLDNQQHYTDIAASTGCGKTSVNEFLRRFRDCADLSFPLADEITNEYIEKLLYKKSGPSADELYRDFDKETVYKALARKGETLKHLWQKYNAVGTVDGLRPLS